MRISESLSTKFELFEQEDNTKVWNVKAISATITGNKREYTREELQLGARSLSFRPLNINHDVNQTLPFPENQTLEMEYDINEDAVVGRIQVTDETINKMIEAEQINKLSIEQVPTKGENCTKSKCTQKGVTFTALALLTNNVEAGDPTTKITPAQTESVNEDEVFVCEKCKVEFDSLDELNEHYKEKHPENSSDNTELKSKTSMTSKEEIPKEADVTVEETPAEVDVKVSETPKEEEETKDNLVTLTKDQFEDIKNQNVQLVADFTKALQTFKATEKKEAVPSSKVDESPKVESFKAVHEFFDSVKAGSGSSDSQWTINLDEMYSAWGYKSEAVTISSGDRPQVYDNQVIVTPDGKTRVPIRQFCNVTKLSGADRAHWYTMGGVSFGGITEGTEPTNESQTLTKVTATPAIRGAVQRIGFSQIEDVPALTGAINQAFALEAISDEESLLHTEFDSVTATNWIQANDGSDISSSDDVSGMTFNKEGIIYGLKALATQGYDTSAGNVVLILHPKAFAELLNDSDLSTFYQQGQSQITATGALSQLYGVQIVVSPNVTAQNNTTNDTYRNIMFVKGAFGIATARDMSMEAQRRNEVQQVVISGTQRIAVKTLDEKQVVRISSAQ
jgi:hypothetical protein